MTVKELKDYLAGFKDEDEVKVSQTPTFTITALSKEEPKEEPKPEAAV